MRTAEGSPEPLIEIAIEPRSAGDRETLSSALSEIVQHDPTLRFSVDRESGQIVLGGMDEPHVEIVVNRIKRELHVEADFGAPQIAYRETITRPAAIDYTHRKQTGGAGEFARVRLRLEPSSPGSGFIFDNTSDLPARYLTGVEIGLRAAAQDGIVAGFPMIDLKATLIDAAYHEADSSAVSFEIASRASFKDGAAKAAPTLLEPIMRVEVVTPDDCLGEVIGDLHSRRGQVIRMDTLGNVRVINAIVPLANMFGYIGTLRSISGRRAQHTMQFDHYETVSLEPPPDRFPPAIGMRG